MFVLIHLLAGVLIGITLTLVFRDRVVIIMAAVGSVLPDLIDKPLGHIFLANTLNYGRIYGHTLLFFFALLIAGLLLFPVYPRAGPLILALVAGILSHQFLDFMWTEPVNWSWPLSGPFQGYVPPNFLQNAFFAELFNPSEWIAGITTLFLLVQSGVIPAPGLVPYRRCVAVAGIVFGTAVILSWIGLFASPLTLHHTPYETIITSLIIILGCSVLWYSWPTPLPP
ncbi:MAG: metal-dependent hydrolase [Methanomicrobiales archaeon]|nr:metal-dependent hydrolase [Methanomicrobiales archaeon]